MSTKALIQFIDENNNLFSLVKTYDDHAQNMIPNYIKPFLAKSKKNAHTYEPLIKRYGVIGLILFVLTPFAMTGPVVGSFVGFLIGFRHEVTLFVVLFSTFIAIIIWVYLIKNFEEVLIAYNDMLMSGFLIAALLMLLWYLIKRVLKKDKENI